MNNLEIKKGFTLAEVLITLGIIGVIAAITLPTLINNYQKMQTVNKLKSDYSLVYNALKRAEADYGDMKNWEMGEDPEEFVNKYLKPYLKIIEEYDNDRMIIKRLNGKDLNVGKAYKHYILSNGSSLSIVYSTSSAPRMTIYIDINGFREPNRVGFDMFVFSYSNIRGFAPLCSIRPDREGYKTGASSTQDRCIVGGGGNCCSALIMVDGWKIAEDYPWKNK